MFKPHLNRSVLRCSSLIRPIENARYSRSFSGHHQPTSTSTSTRWFRGRRGYFVVACGAGCALLVGLSGVGTPEAYADAAPDNNGTIRQRPYIREGASKEEQRELLSSQHVQVKRSWESPGLYAWGSNSGRVAAPDSAEAYIKTPKRIKFFDGKLLRDVKLDRKFGVAIDERGDLYQWGTEYDKNVTQPERTLQGKNLVSLSISRDRILALSANGKVYSIPVSQEEQSTGTKLTGPSWIPFMRRSERISYRLLQPKSLEYGEKVVALSAGLEHVLLRTSKGRVFSAASASDDFPSRGQLGIPGLTWNSRPEGPYDQCHEVSTLRGFSIKKIAAGDFHSLALDNIGRVFAFGDNSMGQLGFECDSEVRSIDTPTLFSTQKLYSGTNQTPKVTDIGAGGSNSFFTVDATRFLGQEEDPQDVRDLGRVTADTWSCGEGIKGSLGSGRWTHVQDIPTKIKPLSGLFEYDEEKHEVIPIRLARISVGSTHVAAVMNNLTNVNASNRTSANDTNYGADVLWWGGNEFYQLGTGKRNNSPNPIYIAPLEIDTDTEKSRREEHRFQITPRQIVKVGGRRVSIEQRVECGRNVTAVYSGV